MRGFQSKRRRMHAIAIVSTGLAILVAGQLASGDEKERESNPRAKFVTESVRGRVVFMADALKRRYGIKSIDEAQQRLLALESTDGSLYPIVADIRGTFVSPRQTTQRHRS